MRPYLYVLLVLIIFAILYVLFKDKIKVLYIGLGNKKRIQKKLYRACKECDYLILNDIYIKIDVDKYRHIDTLIFGNKYIYIVKEIVNIGMLKGKMCDNAWRLYYQDEMQLVNNPFLENKRKIDRLENLIELSATNFKSIVLLTDTIQIEELNLVSDFEYLCRENNIMKTIRIIEKNATIPDYLPEDTQRYAKAFYLHSLECEKEIRKMKKGKKKNVI